MPTTAFRFGIATVTVPASRPLHDFQEPSVSTGTDPFPTPRPRTTPSPDLVPVTAPLDDWSYVQVAPGFPDAARYTVGERTVATSTTLYNIEWDAVVGSYRIANTCPEGVGMLVPLVRNLSSAREFFAAQKTTIEDLQKGHAELSAKLLAWSLQPIARKIAAILDMDNPHRAEFSSGGAGFWSVVTGEDALDRQQARIFASALASGVDHVVPGLEGLDPDTPGAALVAATLVLSVLEDAVASAPEPAPAPTHGAKIAQALGHPNPLRASLSFSPLRQQWEVYVQCGGPAGEFAVFRADGRMPVGADRVYVIPELAAVDPTNSVSFDAAASIILARLGQLPVEAAWRLDAVEIAHMCGLHEPHTATFGYFQATKRWVLSTRRHASSRLYVREFGLSGDRGADHQVPQLEDVNINAATATAYAARIIRAYLLSLRG